MDSLLGMDCDDIFRSWDAAYYVPSVSGCSGQHSPSGLEFEGLWDDEVEEDWFCTTQRQGSCTKQLLCERTIGAPQLVPTCGGTASPATFESCRSSDSEREAQGGQTDSSSGTELDIAVVPDLSLAASSSSVAESVRRALASFKPKATVTPSFTGGSVAHTCSAEALRVRAESLKRYLEKKARRALTKGMIRYRLRKINADARPRVKGRFIKKGESAPVVADAEAVDDCGSTDDAQFGYGSDTRSPLLG